MEPLPVNGRVTIPADELEARTSRAGGPGGQHVNKVESAVELRFDVLDSAALSDAQRDLVVESLAARLARGRILCVRSSAHRSQRRNLEEARERLAELLRKALAPRKKRRATKPTRGSKKRRVEKKRARGELKKGRRTDHGDH